ncbi:MAG TPA: thioredoxin domain-containing protein [Actinomycetota bacterium]|nr:thioredoxin domain-containing protein [Actinomycetota bacterium]
MANRLASATSPYLLQHADNPVDWYEWGEEALDRARREDKPILLSVGYAACHWCHVMERESFEDQDTARIMNEHFVSVKVDREERPDVDAIYMDAVQAMSGHGGWPMTVFLAPSGEPFFAGTYFPKEDRHGMPAFRKVLLAVAEAWRERRDDLMAQGKRVVEAISAGPRGTGEPLTREILDRALDGFQRGFDAEWGGFGPAPKFPQPMSLELLLRLDARGAGGARDMLITTLDRMAAGGMYDVVGGGFHRYSTDRKWLVPHFEKMLYDNAQLASVYLHAHQVTGREDYRRVAEETLDYLLRELRHPDGGFFSSQDADSEGVEGKFYVWSWEELVEVAGEDTARWLGASPSGNWEGSNVLHRTVFDPPAGWQDRQRALRERRSGRIPPATDDKVLTAWNGLAISAFAVTGRALGRSDYVEAATAATDFVLSALRRQDGRLLRAWRDGRTSGPAYADDHALLGLACLDLYETTFDERWFVEGRRLADDLIRLFHDAEGGGFHQTGSDAEGLVLRPKELFDNAVPSGNSAGAALLLRLSLLTGEAEYERVAESALRVVGDLLTRAPTAFGTALGALDSLLGPSREVALIGPPDDPRTEALLDELRTRYLPNVVVASGPERDGSPIPLLEGRTEVNGKPAAYVCERFVCQRPVTERSELAGLLAG